MSRLSFDQYAQRAKEIKDPLIATARLPFHREKEIAVVRDIAQKLRLRPEDRILDIGAGIGDITIPLSFYVKSVTAVDSPECLDRLRSRFSDDRIRYWPGNWLDMEPKESFSAILAYSVIHYLTNMAEVEAFIAKAVSLLESRGRMLIGDIPSVDRRERFDRSPYGSKFNTKWNEDLKTGLDAYSKMLTFEQAAEHNRMFEQDKECVKIGDQQILGLVGSLRAAHFQAWLVPQDEMLPFASQREDILVERP